MHLNTYCHSLGSFIALDGLDTCCFISRPFSIYHLYLLVLIISGFAHLPSPLPHPSIHHSYCLACILLASTLHWPLYLKLSWIPTYLFFSLVSLFLSLPFFPSSFPSCFRILASHTSTLYPAGLDWIHSLFALPFDLLTSLPRVARGFMELFGDSLGCPFHFTSNRRSFHELAFLFGHLFIERLALLFSCHIILTTIFFDFFIIYLSDIIFTTALLS